MDIISARAPQYATDSRLSTLITLAQQRTSSMALGDNYSLAVALRVLHMLDLEALRGGNSANSQCAPPGAMTQKTEGEMSASYASAIQKRYGDKWPDLCQTAYGVELIEVIEGTVLAPMTRILTDGFPTLGTLQ